MSNSINDKAYLPDIARILGEALQGIEPSLQPLLLAALERLAARRYRAWAGDHDNPEVEAGLLACADREEEIARRIESLFPDASAIQERLFAENPEMLNLNRTLFEGRPLRDQFTIQARGEQAGARAWTAIALATSDPSAKELIQSCSPLEEANAEFLHSLL